MARLIRQRDQLVKEGLIEFVEFDKNNRGKNIYMQPKVGYSCIVDRDKSVCTHLTSSITEVISDSEFKTEDSYYKIEN